MARSCWRGIQKSGDLSVNATKQLIFASPTTNENSRHGCSRKGAELAKAQSVLAWRALRLCVRITWEQKECILFDSLCSSISLHFKRRSAKSVKNGHDKMLCQPIIHQTNITTFSTLARHHHTSNSRVDHWSRAAKESIGLSLTNCR